MIKVDAADLTVAGGSRRSSRTQTGRWRRWLRDGDARPRYRGTSVTFVTVAWLGPIRANDRAETRARWGTMRWWRLVLAVVGLVGLCGRPASAWGVASHDALRVRLHRALQAQELSRADADALRRAVVRTERTRQLLPSERARVLDAVLGQAEASAGRLDRARARVLTETLLVNREQLARSGAELRDVRARSGLVYRRYGDSGYQFQPLASFGRVNAAMDAGERARARTLARALLARAQHTRWSAPVSVDT